MSENLLIKQLISQDQQSLQAYKIYQQATDIYRRAQSVLNNTPKYQTFSSRTTTIKVENDSVWSSKIFTCQ